ncbi:MAG: Ig-like domain-containing protein, partial [Gammaproteobacteria bacterium]|nr:Ig-like domain-containing protein [Gammaproteobacteria bacterium]
LHKMTDLGSMAITAAQSSIIVGQEIQLQLSEEADQGMWHVTSDIAQVDESSGWLKALKPGEVEIFYVNQNKQSLAQSLTLVIENLSIVPSVAPELNFLDELHFSSNGGVSPLTWTLESGSEIVSLRSGDIETEIDVLSGEVNGEYVLSVSDALGNQAKVGPFSVVEQLLSVSPTTYELGLQEAQALNILGGVKPYSISISDEAIVSMSQNQVRGIALGETRIIITDARGKSVSLEISVINKPLTISHSQLDLSYPQTETVAAFGGTPPYVWSSNNEAIATVSAIGEVSTQGAGSTVITLSDSSQPNVSITLNTQVIVPPLEIINANGILWVGNGNKLQVEARGGIPPYVWSSEDTDLISINQDGLLTVLATQLDSVESKVSVLLSDSGSTRSHSADFIIRQIAIDQLPTSIAVGEQLTLNGRGFGELAWSLSDNDLASIDPQSVFTALDVGMLSIILQDELANQTQHEIEVTAIPVLIQTTASNELFIGDEIVLNGQGEGDLLWLSSDEMILQKSGSQNNEVSFKAIAAGSVRILLTDARQAQTAVFDVVVHANRLSGLPAHVEKSQLVQLQAVGKPPMIWSLTNDSVARVEIDELGQHALLTALTAGQTQIHISDANGNQVSSPLIDVQPIPVNMQLPLTQIFVVGEVIHLSASGDGELSWSVTPAQGEFTNQDSTSVDFTPSNTGDIVLTVTDAVGTSASSESRTVYQPIVINTIINSMQAGERVFIFAQGNGRLLWRVSDTSKAYINANTGELLALHAGEIRVIISDEFGVSVASDLITINEAVTVINTAISTMTIGQSQQFTGSGNGNLSWSVSNTNVASIDASSGLLNAIAAGEVEVILTDAIGNLVR